MLDVAAGERRRLTTRARRSGATHATAPDVVRVGVIGYGYWGPNIVRNLHGLENAPGRRGLRQEPGGAQARAPRLYPGVHLTTDFADVLQSPDIDAVAVVTPVWTHFELAQGGPRERQARLRREAVHLDVAAGRGADRAGRAQEPEDHGGPHLPLQRRGQEDPRARRRGHARAALLLRFDAREPRPVPARRQRRVGPRAARSLDHGPHHRARSPKRSSRPAAIT